MYGLIVFLHVVACVLIATVVLMQSGRGGGLTEGFASAESLFGAKTNVFMVKLTTGLAVVFFATSLVLAFLSSSREKSLMAAKQKAVTEQAQEAVEETQEAVEETQEAVEQTQDAVEQTQDAVEQAVDAEAAPVAETVQEEVVAEPSQ